MHILCIEVVSCTPHTKQYTDAYASMHIPCMVTERTLAVRSRGRQGAHARSTRNNARILILYYIVLYCIVLYCGRQGAHAPRTQHTKQCTNTQTMHEYLRSHAFKMHAMHSIYNIFTYNIFVIIYLHRQRLSSIFAGNARCTVGIAPASRPTRDTTKTIIKYNII